MSHLKGFSQKELHKWGWKEGKGLGKIENGISSAIKVKRKNNKGGLGHDHGCDFSFNWWDHVFNKTASSLEVCNDQNGAVKINKTEYKTKITPTLISNKRPCFQYNSSKPLLYGTFVSAGKTTLGDENNPDNENSSSSDNDSSNDNDFSSTKDVLERTFKKTGLTGHKAARHGLKLNGKLQRINNQERDVKKERNNKRKCYKQGKQSMETYEDNIKASDSASKKTKDKKNEHTSKIADVPKNKKKKRQNNDCI